MFQTVELPIWLLVLILLFAAVTFASHFLFPSVRWFFRRRAERVVAKLNAQLERPIQPFKLAARQDMIQRLIFDPEVAEAIADHAREEGVPEAVGFERARRYAREIVPSFSASLYFGLAIRMARGLSRALYTVHLDHRHDSEFDAIDPDATVVFIMNHRSNMDYVLVTYLVADRSALSYAVGEWARVWPLSRLIRAMGAFFIRRRSRNALYRRVLARYVQLATKGGVTQAIFPEGGLSLDGSVGPPKLGLLSYILSDFDPSGRDVVFVPVGLNYDRVLEDRVLTQAAERGERKFRASITVALMFAARYIWRRLRGRAKRFGHAGVAFGTPLSLKHFLQTDRADLAGEVGAELRQRVEEVVPPLPVPLVCHMMWSCEGPVTRADLIDGLRPVMARLNHPALEDVETCVRDSLDVLLTRHILDERDGVLTPRPENKVLVDFYARSVAHLM